MKSVRKLLTAIGLLSAILVLAPAVRAQNSASITRRLADLEALVAKQAEAITGLRDALAKTELALKTQEAKVDALNLALAVETRTRIHEDTQLTENGNNYVDARIASVMATVTQADNVALSSAKSYTDNLVSPLNRLLAPLSRVGNDLFIIGANLHIRNGNLGTFSGVNGLGNLIIGYNDLRGNGTDVRTGSHNLILGFQNNYASYGAIVAGAANASDGPLASIYGGTGNLARGNYSAILGGYLNTTSGGWSTVGGGQHLNATGETQFLP